MSKKGKGIFLDVGSILFELEQKMSPRERIRRIAAEAKIDVVEIQETPEGKRYVPI